MAKNIDADIRKVWGISDKQKIYLEEANSVQQSKHGVLSSIPLICKGSNCRFFDTCQVSCDARIAGTRCLTEISAIVTRFKHYCEHFEINLEEERIHPKDIVDVSLIRDLIDKEIQIIRAENKIAISGDFMAERISQIDKKCNVYYEEVVHPAVELQMKLVEDRGKILSKLNATRKDKISLLSGANNLGVKAQTVIDTVREKAKTQGLSINLDDMNNINNVLNDIDNIGIESESE